jgi:SAM-dependent methyltransferase
VTTPKEYKDYRAPGMQADFERVQRDMLTSWRNGLEGKTGAAEADRTRQEAYELRWREALALLNGPSTILDIGCGLLWDDIFRKFKSGGHTYFGLDIDPAVIGSVQTIGPSCGIPSDHFSVCDNTSLKFESGLFDLVFSSHCLEHSLDLRRTFAEIRRVLKPGGQLMFAVPPSWDSSIEHLYLLDVESWMSFVSDAGFTVRSMHIGDFYSKGYQDLVIVAQPREEAPHRFELEPFRKSNYRLLPHTSAELKFVGAWNIKEDTAIGLDASAEVVWEGVASEVVFLLGSHDWSGLAQITTADQNPTFVDLFSWFSRTRSVFVHGSQRSWVASGGAISPGTSRAGCVRVRCVGKNTFSHSAELVLNGVLIRE